MDPPPENDEGLMIQKFIMSWDDEVEVVNALEEVDKWLERSEVSDHVRMHATACSDFLHVRVHPSSS